MLYYQIRTPSMYLSELGEREKNVSNQTHLILYDRKIAVKELYS